MLGIVVFLLGLGLLLLGVSVYRSRWRLPLDLHSQMRLFATVLVVLGTLSALYGVVAAALHTAAESDFVARRVDDQRRHN